MNIKSYHEANMKQIVFLSLIVGMLVGCGTQLDTSRMTGMTFEEFESEFHLKDALVWETPNLPHGSDSERIYFLKDGDLLVKLNSEDSVTDASFEFRDNTPQERLDSVHKGWDEFIESRNLKK